MKPCLQLEPCLAFLPASLTWNQSVNTVPGWAQQNRSGSKSQLATFYSPQPGRAVLFSSAASLSTLFATTSSSWACPHSARAQWGWGVTSPAGSRAHGATSSLTCQHHIKRTSFSPSVIQSQGQSALQPAMKHPLKAFRQYWSWLFPSAAYFTILLVSFFFWIALHEAFKKMLYSLLAI